MHELPGRRELRVEITINVKRLDAGLFKLQIELTLTEDERREALRTDSTPLFAPGDAVLLHPKKGGEVLDLTLRGERATIASIEEDFEGRVHCAVTVDADPGRDLGADRMSGHRFFFGADELERII